MLRFGDSHLLERDKRRNKTLWIPFLPDGISEREPPDPIPNSEVKTLCADGSVACCHVRVGHCQALIEESPDHASGRGFRPWEGLS